MEHCPSWPRNNGCCCRCCWPCPAAALIKNSKIKLKIFFLTVILTQMEQWMQVEAWLVDCSGACITRLYILYIFMYLYRVYVDCRCWSRASRKPKLAALYRCHCSVLGWQLNPTRFDSRFLSRQAGLLLAANICEFACSCGILHKGLRLHSWKSWLRLWFGVALHCWRNWFSLGLAWLRRLSLGLSSRPMR